MSYGVVNIFLWYRVLACCVVVLLLCSILGFIYYWCVFFQAEDGIRDLVRSRGLGDVYKRQGAEIAEIFL